jgi:hypothetical protein
VDMLVRKRKRRKSIFGITKKYKKNLGWLVGNEHGRDLFAKTNSGYVNSF